MNMNKMLKQAQKMQQQMVKMQEGLNEMTVEGTAGGNVVKVTMNGNMEITAVKLDPQAVDPDDVEMLEDLIMAAINQAREKAKEIQDKNLSGITGGMQIPGLS